MNSRRKYALAGFLFVLPSFIYYLLVFLYPLILSFINSFSEINIIAGSRTFTGLTNYKNLFSRVTFYKSIMVTLRYVIISVPLMLIFDLLMANILAFIKGKKGALLITLSFIPFFVSMVSAGMIWDWLMDPNLGLINTVLSFLGVTNLPLWLRGTETALYSAIIINLWIRCPFGILIFIGGVKNIPQSYYEAAMIDGASAIKRFFKITLPLLNPQIIMVLTLETIFGFKIFDTIYASTGGGPAGSTKTVMIYLIKDVYQKDYGMASAITVLLVLCLFTISLLQQVFLTKRVEY